MKQKGQEKAKSSDENIPPAVLVFSKTRDLDSLNPYHLDGDM